MLQRTPVFSALTPELLSSGLLPDVHLVQKMLWSAAENVSFQNGRVRRIKPKELLFEAGTEAVRGIAQLRDTNGTRWVYAGSGPDVVRWYGPAVEAVFTADDWTEDPTVLYPASFWDLLPFGNWVIMNNGRGKVNVYKPGTGVEELTDSPEDITRILKKDAFIIAFGYSENGNRVRWTDADNIDVWTAAADNLAGSLTVAEFATPLKAAEHLGTAIAMYSEDQMAQLSFLGAPFYFGYKFKLDGIGACGPMSVASAGAMNVGVGRNGVWWTDGMSFKYLDEGSIRNYLQDNVNWDQQSKIVAMRNDITGCFDFSFPMGDSLVPDEGWSIDPRNNSWYEIEPFSFKQERVHFNGPLIGDLSGNIYRDYGQEDGNNLVLETKPLLPQLQDGSGLLDIHNAYRVHEIDVFLHECENVEWRLGSSNNANGYFTYCDWQAAVEGANTYVVPKGVPTAPYHKLEFRSTDTTWQFDLQGFLFFGSIEGVKGRVTQS